MYSREWMAKMRRKEARKHKRRSAAMQKSQPVRKVKSRSEAAA
jgi:hypothetical protein